MCGDGGALQSCVKFTTMSLLTGLTPAMQCLQGCACYFETTSCSSCSSSAHFKHGHRASSPNEYCPADGYPAEELNEHEVHELMRGTAGSLVILTMAPAPAGDWLGFVSSNELPMQGGCRHAEQHGQSCMACWEQPAHSLMGASS